MFCDPEYRLSVMRKMWGDLLPSQQMTTPETLIERQPKWMVLVLSEKSHTNSHLQYINGHGSNNTKI